LRVGLYTCACSSRVLMIAHGWDSVRVAFLAYNAFVI
jgi:hypothetical protein